jgi:SAM-dependent methyltransferase
MRANVKLVSPLNAIGYLKQEWLYSRYLSNRGIAESFCKKYIPENLIGKWVLDFGCGKGRHSAMLSRLGFHVAAIDPQMHDYWGKINATFYLGDDKNLPNFKAGDFDLALCFLVLYLIEDNESVLKQLHRLLKPGGYLVLQVPNKDNLWTRRTGRYLNSYEPIKRYYSIKEVTQLLTNCGFSVDKLWMEKFYSSYMLETVNGLLSILPHQVGDFASKLTSPSHRGLINVWARKS